MNTKAAILSLLLILGLGIAEAQDSRYATVILKETGDLLRSHGVTVNAPGIYNLPGKNNLKFEVRCDTFGKIIHLGIPVVNRELTRTVPSPIYDFIERYILQLRLMKVNEKERLMADDKVVIKGDVYSADTICGFSMKSNGKMFSTAWEKSGRVIATITFPVDYELITGHNKKEIETGFRKDVENYDDSNNLLDDRVCLSDMITEDSLVYIQKNGYYIIKDMSSARYYIKDADGDFVPINSENFPAETISNLFEQIITGHYTLNIEQRMYGNRKQIYPLKLSKLTSYCRDTGCNPYVGIESTDKDTVKATILYVNQALNYNHMLFITAPIDVLRAKKGNINAFMYCYIPTQNVKALFQPNELEQIK